MELRHWKNDINPYSLPRLPVRNKLPTRLKGRSPLGGDVPKSPFIALGLLPSAGMISREIAVSFGTPLASIFPLRLAFQASGSF